MAGQFPFHLTLIFCIHAVGRPFHVSFFCQESLRQVCNCLMSNGLAQKTHCKVLQLNLWLCMQF